MTTQSAGLLLYRRTPALQVLLAHPGGPFWAGRDDGAWTIPKGVIAGGEEPIAAARREFSEETGLPPPTAPFIALGIVRQPGGKLVHAWAAEGDCDARAIRSNTFSMEWPRGSDRFQEFPEIDRAGWFSLDEAARRILPGQRPFLERLGSVVSGLQ